MAVTTVKRTLRSNVEERVKAHKCLHCDEEAKRRGLCLRHYYNFYRALQAKPESDRIDFEATCIRDGKVLASNEIRKFNSDNPFTE